MLRTMSQCNIQKWSLECSSNNTASVNQVTSLRQRENPIIVGLPEFSAGTFRTEPVSLGNGIAQSAQFQSRSWYALQIAKKKNVFKCVAFEVDVHSTERE